MKNCALPLAFGILFSLSLMAQEPVTAPRVQIANGQLEGLEMSGVQVFRGIPFAAPPVGPFRWREPMPVANWKGVRKATAFGPRAMQPPLFSDMVFRSNGMSEDCLYLNVWTPSVKGKAKLPVLVYFYGGGLMAGDASEPRYDGESMARKGIVTVTVNYRLGIFGFMSHPELTRSSPHHASGNYGLLDQVAALQWVKKNISAFGGDPSQVTIAGESAGSISVSALMASPLSKNLVTRAIGESGAVLGSLEAQPLALREQGGLALAAAVKAASLADLRALDADALVAAASGHEWEWFGIAVDGYFFTESPDKIYAEGRQAHIPLLAGWNSEEGGYRSLLGDAEPTLSTFRQAVEKLYGPAAPAILEVYKPVSDAEVKEAARDLAGDRFISFGTWKWLDVHARTGGGQPVYRYYYTQPRPASRDGEMPAGTGAVHSAEIEYALGNLGGNRVFDWTWDDHRVSSIMQDYFVNFIRSGNPNGVALPHWPQVQANQPAAFLQIGTPVFSQTEKYRNRYLELDRLWKASSRRE